MRNIEDEFKRVRILSPKIGKRFLTSNQYKDDREVYVLGGFVNLLKLGGEEYPIYYEKYKPPEPDFKTYNTNQKLYKDIEIVENILWGRKKGKEVRQLVYDIKDFAPKCTVTVWYHFIKNINQKFMKFYGQKNTWLIIYHNISVFQISSINYWTEIIFRMKNKFIDKGLIDFTKSTYEKVFVINSGCSELVEIYPEDKVIYSKKIED